MMLHDVFISHASEDKDGFVRALAEELRNRRVEVWYDEFSLRPGDSLRRSIDMGLSRSRYGIVILSDHFFNKSWPQWELDGLVQRQMAGDDRVILPIWHGVTAADVREHSASLANIVAMNSGDGVASTAETIARLVHPQGSSLVVARDLLFDHGIETPVVTDDWWLGIVESSVTVFTPGKWVGVDSSWQFPLPAADELPHTRGKRLAWTALQLRWQEARRESGISQVSHPDEVHDFINSQPGLREACIRFPRILMESAPQLLIPEHSREFGPAFDSLLDASARWYRDLRAGKFTGVKYATALHMPLNQKEAWEEPKDLDGLLRRRSVDSPPCGPRDECEPPLGLRHPNMEKIRPVGTANVFFCSETYDKIDFVAWLLSDASRWLPARHHSFLASGLKKWGVWPWGKYTDLDKRKDYEATTTTGTLARALDAVESADEFTLDNSSRQDALERLSFSAQVLALPESGEELTERFFSSDWIPSYFKCEFAEWKRDFMRVSADVEFPLPELETHFFVD